ncbi:MAG: molybdopterin dinucleotide binding domain-containing protein, partial [Actinoallomurus sp.]
PTHYEPQESPFDNLLYAQQCNPVRRAVQDKNNRYAPRGSFPGSEVYPYVVTTYRVTEHFTAGGMSRWLPYLSELQPAMFVEVSPELAAERKLDNAGWATIVTPRGVIEARVLVTDRMSPLRVGGRTMHQIGMPYHWGPNGLTAGDAFNELSSISLDPNVHIQEVKALAADIQPGRRPRGAARLRYIEAYQQRAGITALTGQES